MPLVSIIMPVYNVEDYLADAISSVLMQDHYNIELIVIDDGSTDDSLKIAELASRGDDRVNIYEQSNLGLAATRNRGISLSKGQYIYFFDSDDLIAPKTISVCLDWIQRLDLDLVTFSGIAFSDLPYIPEIFLAQLQKPRIITPVSGDKLLAQLYRTNAYSPGACLYLSSTKLIKQNNLRFDDGYIHEDIAFTAQVYCKAERAISLSENFFRRRVRDGSIMSNARTLDHIRGNLQATARINNIIQQQSNLHRGAIRSLRSIQRTLLRSSSSFANEINANIDFKNIVATNFSMTILSSIDPAAIFYIYCRKYFYYLQKIKRGARAYFTKF